MTAARSLSRAVLADAHAGASAAAAGAGFAGLVEWIITLEQHPGSLGLVVELRLLCLVAVLMAMVWLALGPLAAAAAALPRLYTRAVDGRAAALARPVGWPAPSRWSFAAAVHVLLGGLAAIGYAIGTTWIGARAITSFKEPILTALVIALAALALGVAAVAFTRAAARGVIALAGGTERARRPATGLLGYTLGSPWWALVIVVTAVAVTLLVAGKLHPHLKPVWPWRRLITLVAFVVGAGLHREWAARRRVRRRDRRVALAAAAVALVLVPATLMRIGAAPQVKFVVVSSSPSLARVIELVRVANDLDGDGFGSLLGENDCAPRDRKVHPGARDYPDNGLDENCDGRDFSMRDLAVPAGPTRPVPPAFRQPWNVLLLTIDTVRYDYTTFGRPPGSPRQRDTTPNLARLAARSTDFTFAMAPSAGTMASVPAIVTSKFFHSGIALDESNNKHGMPPRLKPENLTLPEIMKKGGYTTGAILSHEYFNDWGLQQGVDSYDNEIGRTHDPNRVSSDRLTDRALAWIARHPTEKWFLWIHYLDPHSQYVPHPEDTAWGDSPEDLYESELHFTDKHIGRLLDELIRLPGGDRTIIVVTSDHGDAFGEHGFSGHAVALYREILHVPLLVFVPNNPPRRVGGVVSNLDVVPTIAALCGIPVDETSFEGRNLVPSIFFGDEDPERVVFAETNYPVPIRAAISTSWKLVFNMKSNFYELYDLTRDPLEKQNLASSNPTALADMRAHMDAWLERVVFSRDANMNQAAMRMQKVLLPGKPELTHPTPGLSIDQGAIEILGYEVTGAGAGSKAIVTVYMHAVRRPSRGFRFGAVLWAVPPVATDGGVTPPQYLTAPIGGEQARAGARVTLDGLLPSDRWRPGEYLREELTVAIPPTWTSPQAMVGLVVGTSDGTRPDFAGPQPANDPSALSLGPWPVVVPLPPVPNPLNSPDAGAPPGGP